MTTYSWAKSYVQGVPHSLPADLPQSIMDHLEQSFSKYHRLPAASCMDVTLTYAELQVLVRRFAAFLQQSLGLKKGDRLALVLPNSFQFLIAELAALRLGVICVNTNPMYTPRELQHQLKDSGATSIVILDLFMDKLEQVIQETEVRHVVVTSIADQLPLWKSVLLKSYLQFKKLVPRHNLKVWAFKDAMKAANPETLEIPSLVQSDLAILQYTGGTTGVAKGAMLTHGNLLANMLQLKASTSNVLVPGSETILAALPLYHIFALSVTFLGFLAEGNHVVLLPKPVPIQNTVKALLKYRITVFPGVNTLFNAIVHNKGFKALDHKHYKLIIAGGMALQEQVSKAFQSITGCPIYEGYGLTEASPVTHLNPVAPGNPGGSIGIPLPSTVAKILSEDGQECAPGVVGELVISGPQVMLGYWNRPEDTAAVLKNGWLWTGDLARIDENGYFYIVDRKKDMILVSGFNVYPNEVEDVLTSYPKVLEAAVVGVPDKACGEAVKAFIVPKDNDLSQEELKVYCKSKLTGYKCPRHFEFRESLPKSNVGKILRKELKSQTESP